MIWTWWKAENVYKYNQNLGNQAVINSCRTGCNYIFRIPITITRLKKKNWSKEEIQKHEEKNDRCKSEQTGYTRTGRGWVAWNDIYPMKPKPSKLGLHNAIKWRCENVPRLRIVWGEENVVMVDLSQRLTSQVTTHQQIYGPNRLDRGLGFLLFLPMRLYRILTSPIILIHTKLNYSTSLRVEPLFFLVAYIILFPYSFLSKLSNILSYIVNSREAL